MAVTYHGPAVIDDFRGWLSGVLQRAGVDVTPCGHDHAACSKYSHHRHIPVIHMVWW